MSPLGHVAVGYLAGRTATRGRAHAYAWITAVAAAFVDVDFVLVWSPHFNAWHRVVTHNLTFVLAIAMLATWPVARRWSLSVAGVFAAIVGGGVSHVLVDACLDTNATNGIGVAIAWPFSDQMWSPVNLVATKEGSVGWSDPVAAIAASSVELLFEAPFVVLAAWLAWRARGRAAASDHRSHRHRPMNG